MHRILSTHMPRQAPPRGRAHIHACRQQHRPVGLCRVFPGSPQQQSCAYVVRREVRALQRRTMMIMHTPRGPRPFWRRNPQCGRLFGRHVPPRGWHAACERCGGAGIALDTYGGLRAGVESARRAWRQQQGSEVGGTYARVKRAWPAQDARPCPAPWASQTDGSRAGTERKVVSTAAEGEGDWTGGRAQAGSSRKNLQKVFSQGCCVGRKPRCQPPVHSNPRA